MNLRIPNLFKIVADLINYILLLAKIFKPKITANQAIGEKAIINKDARISEDKDYKYKFHPLEKHHFGTFSPVRYL